MKETTMKETRMKIVMAMMMMAMTAASTAMGGSLDPAAGPAPTMYTLEQIYTLIAGADAAASQLPPYVAAAEAATANEVKGGVGFWSLTTDEWGPRTGTLPVVNTPTTIAPTTTPQSLSAAIYQQAITVSGDADLVATNIRNQVEIFGVTGTRSSGPTYAAEPFKTGQTISYQTGDDGHYEAGLAPTTPRFTVNGEMVSDNFTGLMWTKQLKPINSAPGWWSWGNLAINDLINNNATYGNYANWRYPSVVEVMTVIDFGTSTGFPAGAPFSQNTGGTRWVWTGTPYAEDSSKVWIFSVSHYGGPDGRMSVASKGSDYHIWPVRAMN